MVKQTPVLLPTRGLTVCYYVDCDIIKHCHSCVLSNYKEVECGSYDEAKSILTIAKEAEKEL